tara:strand:+ start:5858 stop:6232 length:375 start_codon:yes stop_codon:yes gene_type:complete
MQPSRVGKIIGTPTGISANNFRWLYRIQPIEGYSELTLQDTEPDWTDQLVEEALPGLNLAEFGNTASAVGDYSADNIPSSFTVRPISGLVLFETTFMVFDQATGAKPEVGCLFYGINAIDGGCT